MLCIGSMGICRGLIFGLNLLSSNTLILIRKSDKNLLYVLVFVYISLAGIQRRSCSFILEIWDMTVFMHPAMSALIQTDLSCRVWRIRRWCPYLQCCGMIWHGQLFGRFLSEKTPQHSSLCLQMKALTRLTLLPRNQCDNSNTHLHFSASHLFVPTSASPFHSASPLVCLHRSSPGLLHTPLMCFAKSLRVGMIPLETFIIRNSRERVWCQRSSAVLTSDFEQSIRLRLECPQQLWLCPPGAFG